MSILGGLQHQQLSLTTSVLGLDALDDDLHVHLCIPANPGGGKGEEDRGEVHDGLKYQRG